MDLRKWIAVVAGCGMLAAFGTEAETSNAEPPRRYEVSVQTSMPHLDENLRYATRTQRQCLGRQDLSAAFWMLREPALQDCRLVKASESAEAIGYVLACEGGHGTTGTAEWQLGRDGHAGTLNVRLGGKNMTFYQRARAKLVGGCDAAASGP